MKLRVAVLYGGRSGEHEVSINSAKAIMQRMDPAKYEIIEYFIDKQGKWKPRPILPEPGAQPEIDVVFPVLHGTFGEDGTVQGLLELADLAYVGAGVLASSVSMDKEMMKRVCTERMLPVVDYVTVTREPDVGRSLRAPAVSDVRQAGQPGLVGGDFQGARRKELEAAVALAAQYDRKIVVERGIAGRELECSVLGNEAPVASLPCEILPSREFYDYEDKYLLDRAQTSSRRSAAGKDRGGAPAGRGMLPRGGMRGHGARRFPAGSRHRPRLYQRDQHHPRLHLHQHVPKMWEHSGISFSALIDRLIELALDRHQRKKATRFAR
jgi:D-alanine-D-alanine ligase